MTKIGIIGVGYWGPNLVRNFDSIPDCEIVSICDLDEANLDNITNRYPYVKRYNDVDEMIQNENLDGVVMRLRPRPILDWPRKRSKPVCTYLLKNR